MPPIPSKNAKQLTNGGANVLNHLMMALIEADASLYRSSKLTPVMHLQSRANELPSPAVGESEMSQT